MTSAPSPAKCRPSGRSSMPSMARTRAAVRAHQAAEVDDADPADGLRCTCVRAVQAVRLAVVDDLGLGAGHAQVAVVRRKGRSTRAPIACRARTLAWSEASSQASYVGSHGRSHLPSN